jgi:hypothetical protein
VSDPGYDPLPDLAEVLADIACQGDRATINARSAKDRLAAGLGVGGQVSSLPWLDALRKAQEAALGNGMPGTPTGRALTERTEIIARLEAKLGTYADRIAVLTAENAQLDASSHG